MSATNSDGFTLIEVLIAVGLLAILTTALYGSYFGVARARERTAAVMESSRELSDTLDLIRREVEAAVPPPVTPSTNMTREQQLRPRLVVEDRDYFGLPSSTLTITTRVPTIGDLTPGSGTVRVTYQIIEKNGKRILRRQERDIFSEDSTVPFLPQMERISSFLVECYYGSKWVKTFDTEVNRALPDAVRITVQVGDEGKLVAYSILATPKVGK